MNPELMLTSTLSALRTNVALRRTVGYYLLFLCLGLNMGVLGPTLPALAEQTHAALGQMGLVFLAGSIGYTIGTVVGGRIFDRARGHPVLGLAQLGVAAMILLTIPLSLPPRYFCSFTSARKSRSAAGSIHMPSRSSSPARPRPRT